MRNVYIGMPRSGRSPSKVVSCTFLLHELPPLQWKLRRPPRPGCYNSGCWAVSDCQSSFWYLVFAPDLLDPSNHPWHGGRVIILVLDTHARRETNNIRTSEEVPKSRQEIVNTAHAYRCRQQRKYMQAWQTGYKACGLQRGAMCREDDWQDGRTKKRNWQAIQTGMADRQCVRRDRQDSRFRIYTYMMVLASLVAISGPKKISISRAHARPSPSNAPRKGSCPPQNHYVPVLPAI
jgi:hypothetical protein